MYDEDDEFYSEEDYMHPEGWDKATLPVAFPPGSRRLKHEDSAYCWCEPTVVKDKKSPKGYRIIHSKWIQ